MHIDNHKLVADFGYERVEFLPDLRGAVPDWGAELKRPRIVVIHYAVTQSSGETSRALDARDYVSCHVTIDRTGLVIQKVPLNRVAYHAGKSAYRGVQGCNAFSLGIEISNPGPLLQQTDGSFTDIYKRPWDGGVHEADKPVAGYRYWAEYSQAALDLCAQLCDLFRAEYAITDIVGHGDVAPGRKIDPGPAFPMAWLGGAVFGDSWKERHDGAA